MDTLWFNVVQWLHTLGLPVDGSTARAVGDAAASATAQLDMPSMLALAAALVMVRPCFALLSLSLRVLVRSTLTSPSTLPCVSTPTSPRGT